MPEITINLPIALGLIALFLAVGAGLVYMAMRRTPAALADATITPTATLTATATQTSIPFTPTVTSTPLPTPTPLSYVVKAQDTCLGIAFSFGISVQSIVLLNPELSADCSNIFENQKLLIPQPTPTPTPLPTATLNPAEATEAACDKFPYTVQENDTLSSIALNFNVTMQSIRDFNGLVSETVRLGQQLQIPLCQRIGTPGPTPTPTPPPPYPAPNLLLPADGAAFTLADDLVALQWATVGELRANEAYAVSIEDVTEGQGRKLVEYVTDTKYNVPVNFRANNSNPHVYRWWILPVRQTGTDKSGNPVWDSAGAPSPPRVFIWSGVTGAVTPTP